MIMERVMGIEPTLSAWKAEVLPLNYTRVLTHKSDKMLRIPILLRCLKHDGRDDTIRTCDPLVPNQVLYQAELRPDIIKYSFVKMARPERFELPAF
jgi:hypothetical protein